MGYCMSQRAGDFMIARDDVKAAHRAVLDTARALWKDKDFVDELSRTSFADTVWRGFYWDVYEDDHGDITGIWFNGEKAGDEDELFSALAPFVVSGSFIEMQGEDGTIWRWVFTDGEVKEIVGELRWDMPPHGTQMPGVPASEPIDVTATVEDLVRLRSELR